MEEVLDDAEAANPLPNNDSIHLKGPEESKTSVSEVLHISLSLFLSNCSDLCLSE